MTTAKTSTPVPFSASSKLVRSQTSPLEREFILESERDESDGKASPIEGIALMEKGSETMATTQAQRGSFEDYNRLFNLLAEMDDRVRQGKTFSYGVQVEGDSWSFVIYHPKRVASFRLLAPVMDDPEFQEACQQQLGLLEICKGRFKYPEYVAITPHVDVYGLKKKWCRDYCQFHGIDFLIKKVSEEETHASPKAEEGV